MQQELPKTFNLQTNYKNKYLRYIAIDRDSNDVRLIPKDKYLQPDSSSEFETEASGFDDGLFVSIKSSYNNKYLVVSTKSENDDQLLVSPIADTPNEDQSNESCTLFKPYFVGENDNNSQVRFFHAHYKTYLCFSVTNSCLFLLPSSVDKDHQLFDLFTFTDVEPSPGNHYIYAFEGDNKKFLSIFKNEEFDQYENKLISYLKFFVEDQQSPHIWFECHPGKDNKVLEIKSISENSYWACGISKWVVVDGTPEYHGPTQFQFDGQKSAFMVNGNYCQRNIENRLGGDKKDCFIANTHIFTEQARLKLHRKPKEDDDSHTK